MDKKDLRILFLGTPEISAVVLENLIINGYNIVGIVAQQDKPIGRKQIVSAVPTKVVGFKYGIKVYQPVKIRLDFSFVKDINPDLILTLAYGQLIPHEMLEIPKYGCLNLHGSLLPKYRGAAPIQFALLNGEKKTGITLMEMVDKMDAGKMYLKKEVDIIDDDNYDSLVTKLEGCAYNCFDEGIQDYIDGKNKGIEQNEDDATFTRKINEEDQIINFDNSAFEIHNKIRALSCNPGVYFSFHNEKIKVFKSIVEDGVYEVGKIIKYDKNGLLIGTKNGALLITELQKPGKRILKINDFYNGNQKLFVPGENLI
ncbi:MAG: methionyl-tRNA formyltransferase [Bacilli bacterium]